MNYSNDKKELSVIVTIVLAAVASRLLPHPPNMTAVMAVALFTGARLNQTALAFALPLLAMLISDSIIGFHSSQLVVYACVALITFLGMSLRNTSSFLKIFGMSFVGSVVFFLATNFAVWAMGTMYPHDLEGLIVCYAAALPFYATDNFQFLNSSQLFFGSFFANGVIGDLFFTGLVFGTYELVRKYTLQPTTK